MTGEISGGQLGAFARNCLAGSDTRGGATGSGGSHGQACSYETGGRPPSVRRHIVAAPDRRQRAARALHSRDRSNSADTGDGAARHRSRSETSVVAESAGRRSDASPKGSFALRSMSVPARSRSSPPARATRCCGCRGFGSLARGTIMLRFAEGAPLYGIGGTDAFDKNPRRLLLHGRQVARAGAQGDAGAPLVWSTAGFGVLVDSNGATFNLTPGSLRVSRLSRPDPDLYLIAGKPKADLRRRRGLERPCAALSQMVPRLHQQPVGDR